MVKKEKKAKEESNEEKLQKQLADRLRPEECFILLHK